MINRIFAAIASTAILSTGTPAPSLAQNLLQDSGFDGGTNLTNGNNLHDLLPDWRFAEVVSPTLVFKNAHNIVRVDGPGGFDYLSGSGQVLGPESDASGSPAGTAQHYIDSGHRKSLAWQYFTPQCSGVATAHAFFSNREGHGYQGGTLSGQQLAIFPNLGVFNTLGGVSIIPTTVQIPQFPGGPASVPAADRQNVIDLEAAHDAVKFPFLLGAGDSRTYPWTSFSTQAQVQAGQTYAFVAELGASVNMDNASVELQCGIVVTPQDVTLNKTCELVEAHTHNGVLGQRWECQVDVTSAAVPFTGNIILHDVFTNTALVNGQILLGESVSGNGSCFQGDCQIDGANFDTSGTESFTFDVFVEAAGPADVYPLENCVTGELDDGSGTLQTLTPDCTTGQWVPRSEVVKTCDPIPANATAPYTMNCQIQVTASGLAAGTYVSVMDAFAAQPPSVATVIPSFMNVTSTENWSCIDHQSGPPTAIGICELPAADLMAAGGTSTLDISFQFNVDQAPTQVANCRFTDIHDGSYLAKLTGQRNALRSPIRNGATQNSGWPQMPDGCVYVDVPGVELPPKVETKITKDCNQPSLTSFNGTMGYLWQCEAEVEVTPSPFAGNVSFTDDGSQISMGSAEFVSVSEPASICQGLGTDTLNCSFPGATFSSPHVVQYDLFTPYIQTTDEIEWKNCIRGEAVTSAGSFPSIPMCVERTIKPTDVSVFPPAKDIKLQKVCEEAGREMDHDGQSGLGWDCKIIVSASPAPFSGNFTFTENASNILGSSGQIIAIDQPQPASWACSPSVPTQSTDCTISGANFDPSGTEAIGFTLFAPNTGEPIAWENCVSGVYASGDGSEPQEVPGNCQAITWKPPVATGTPAFEVQKDCKPAGDRQIMGPSAWFQPWACTITVTSNGVPFTDTLWLDEDMLYGPHNGSQSVVSVTSNDPWQCTPAPYAPGGNQPACGIQGNQFPHNSSTLNVTLNVFGGAADTFGAENCVALSLGDTPSSDPADIIADDCAEILPPPNPKEPMIDLVKACGPAVQAGTGQWTVDCTLTITGQNLPTGLPLRFVDQLISSNTQSATQGQMSHPNGTCTGGFSGFGFSNVCDITTDDLIAANGTLVVPYTGTYQGPAGRPLNGPRAQNCAFVDVPTLGLHGPQGGNGKSCVPIEFKASISSGASDVILDPPTPGGGGTTPPLDGTSGVGSLPGIGQKLRLQKACDPLVFAGGAQSATANCDITVTVPTGFNQQIFALSDLLSVPFSQTNVAQVTNPILTGLPNMGCNVVIGGYGIPSNDCTGADIMAMTSGGQFTFNWRASVGRPPNDKTTYRNCAYLKYLNQSTGVPNAVEACHDFDITVEGGKASEATPTPTPAPILEPVLTTRKQQTADCVANRETQRYTCGFRITVTNEGNAPFNGHLVVTDTFASPYAQAVTQTSQGGWSCAQPIGGAISCEHSGLNLPQGSFAYIDLDIDVQGLVNGGQSTNCAAAGIPANRKQRVAAIQQVLNARGFAAGPVDGLPGNRTYTALAELQRSLGLPVRTEFDDALFQALGLPLAKPGAQSCIPVDLPRMPKPRLQCDRVSTVEKGDACQCRYDSMVRRDATSCQCKRGYILEVGKGCVKAVTTPVPPPLLEDVLKCDPNSTRLRDGKCVCLDRKNAVRTSKTSCGCKNGLPMVNGKCLPINIAPKPQDGPVGTEGGDGKCVVTVNGICLKYK